MLTGARQSTTGIVGQRSTPTQSTVATVTAREPALVLLNRTSLVELFDRIRDQFNPVRAFAIGFGVYGVARIVYLLIFQPPGFHESPLSQLITRLIH